MSDSYHPNLTYLIGDATEPKLKYGFNIIAHICNNSGGWGRGFVMALSRKWDRPEKRYRQWASGGTYIPFELGYNQYVRVGGEEDIYVCNMIAQDGFASEERPVAVDYTALESCLSDLAAIQDSVDPMPLTVHMPRIGTGLGGGDWEIIEDIIIRMLCDYGIIVYVYDLESVEVNKRQQGIDTDNLFQRMINGEIPRSIEG